MDPKYNHINYLYFGGLLALLVFIAAGSVFTKENLGGSQFFFFLYALGQVILEITFFVFASLLIRRYLGKFCFAFFIGITFFAMFLHMFDFMMDRILDLSVWESLQIFVFQETLGNFLYLLDASGVPLWAWFTFFLLLAALPLFGFFLFKMSEKISGKKPFIARHSFFLQTFLCVPCALFFWDFSASKVIHPDAYTAFIKSLPWKFTFLSPRNVMYSVSGPVRQPLNEGLIVSAIDENNTVLAHKPNIYLFVVESLREDCMTAEIAPHLHQFKKTYTSFDTALSNGNGTHLSWFSIFHSQFPYYWREAQKQLKQGSPALQLLKKWGYQIRLYSSAQLGYYGMDKVLFGDNLQLVDNLQTFHHAPPLNAANSDAAALAKLQKDLAEDPSLHEGQVFIVFWDCTHFDYSWPKNWAPKFTPFAQEFAYFKAFQSQKAIANIKNRYQNAVNYMDSLFGDFFDNLPNREEAVIAFTGDHGEEFFDHGHLFHNSHLTHEQINVPLYFKLGSQERSIQPRSVISQMDIFPTIIDHVSETTLAFLEGNSLYREPKLPYALTARFNAGLTPYEFSIHNGKNKLIAQFLNRQNIVDSKELQILSIRTRDDKSINQIKDTNAYLQSEFGPALHHLFGPKETE
jgi:glucan phosphoethanolaminetransferase (alkaline phosphatase superfamily)